MTEKVNIYGLDFVDLSDDVRKKNRVKVEICGQSYTILSDETKEYTLALAREVSRVIGSAISPMKGISAFMAATLAAMDYCDRFKKAENALEALKEHSRKSLAAEVSARSEIEKLRKEIKTLKSKKC